MYRSIRCVALTRQTGQPRDNISLETKAQDPIVTKQIWIDLVADFYTGDIGLLDLNLGFYQSIGGSHKWTEVMFTPIYELYPNYRFDSLGNLQSDV